MANDRLRSPSALVAGCLLLSLTSGAAAWTPRPPAEDIPLHVMTFNLRYAGTSPPNAWTTRRPIMRDCIRDIAPDLMGTQEGLYQQLKDLAADLPGYEWIGLGREGAARANTWPCFTGPTDSNRWPTIEEREE